MAAEIKNNMLTSIILAGGRGRRLGQHKPSTKLAGMSLIEWVIQSLDPLKTEIIVVNASPHDIPTPSVRTVYDVIPGKGPLVGIYSGLKASEGPASLVVACDMPFLNARLLYYMFTLLSGYDIVIPRIDEKVEPLHAIYSKSCLGPIEELLRRDELQTSNLLSQLNVRYVSEEELNKFDPEHLSFFNINTKTDLEQAEQIAQRLYGIDKLP